MKLTTARLKKLIREELERIQEFEDYSSRNLERSGGDYEMKDGTQFDVDVYRSGSEETLRVTVNGVQKLVGKVEDKEEIIKKLQSMDLETAKSFGGPLFEEKK